MENMQPQINKKKSNILNGLLGLFALFIAISVTRYFYIRLHFTHTDDASVKQNMVPVNCRVGGFAQKIFFDEFEEVKAGDTLLIIDPTDYVIRLNQAEAGLENALANQSAMKANVSTLANAQTIAEANLKETEARLWNAEQNYKRYKQLLDEKSVTTQQFDQVKTEYESLKARHQAMLKGLEGAKLSTNEAKTRYAASSAGVKSAQVGVKAAQQNLDYTIVLSPCDGITGRKTIHEGQLLQTGQNVIQIVDKDKKWITANFLEKQAEHLKSGNAVKIEVDAFPETEFSGIIESIAGATGSVFSLVPTDNATGNFVKIQQRIPVKIIFDANTPAEILKELRAGMNAEVFVK